MPFLMRVVAVVFGAAAIAAAFWLRHMNARAQAWPSTSGRIVKSILVPDPHDAGSSVEITYQFKVGDRDFTSDRVSYTAMRNDLWAKERLVARYPAGSVADVFYDPANPKHSVLIRGDSSTWLWLVATGVVFVATGAFAP
jgi:Protein of unknown function (DUF3592)